MITTPYIGFRTPYIYTKYKYPEEIPFVNRPRSLQHTPDFHSNMIPQLIAALTALAVLPVTANPVELSRRGTVGHSDLVGLPQTVPAGATGDRYLAYQPKLKVVNGCVPFPAVDVNGNTK